VFKTTDNLNGITDKIRTKFPQSTKQICVVHQISNANKYVVWKDKKEFAKNMREIYTVTTTKNAEIALNELEKKCNSKYSYPIKSWSTN
jgi:putative transposase